MADSLTLKQERFIAAYLGTARGNGSEAARTAGYATPETGARDNLKNPTIRARIAEDLATRCLTKDAVLAELSDVGLSEWKHHVQVKIDAEGNTIDAKIVLGDKVKALELLGKYHQLFTDKIQQSGKLTVEVQYADPDADTPPPAPGAAADHP